MASEITEFEALLEAAPDAMVVVDEAGVIRYASRQTESMFGYERHDLVGRQLEMLMPELLREDHIAHRGRYSAAPGIRLMGAGLSPTGRRRDGTEFPVNVALSHMESADGNVVIAAVRDMTLDRRVEADRHRADRLLALVQDSDDAIIDTTLEGIITSWNPAAERILGYSAEEIIGTSVEPLIPDDQTEEMDVALARMMAGEHVDRFESARIRKDETVITVSLGLWSIHEADGVIVGTSTTARDVSEAKRAFEAARSMLEASLDSLVAISPEGKITDANEATVTLTGVPRDKLIGTSFSDYFTDPGKAEAIYQRVFTEGMARDYPLTLRHRDGHETFTEVLYNASVYRDASGNVLGVFAAARDVTSQRRAQREMAQQQAKEQERLSELERFQRLTVGRELKMIELKKEIEYLRRLGSAQGRGSDHEL